METLIRTLRKLLQQHFPAAETEWEQAAPAKRVGGFLIWDGFEGIDQTQRQAQVWRVLHKGLTKADQGRITAILTVTPAEVLDMRVKTREQLVGNLLAMSRDLHANKAPITIEILDTDGVWRDKQVNSVNLSGILQDLRQQIQRLKGKPHKRLLKPGVLKGT